MRSIKTMLCQANHKIAILAPQIYKTKLNDENMELTCDQSR